MRQWVFTDENDNEIGTAQPNEHPDAEHAMESFNHTEHFLVYFRTDDGTLNPTDPESKPEDFE